MTSASTRLQFELHKQKHAPCWLTPGTLPQIHQLLNKGFIKDDVNRK